MSPALPLQSCRDSVSPDLGTKPLSSSWDKRNPTKTSLGRGMPSCQGWLNPLETQGIIKSPGNHTSPLPNFFNNPQIITLRCQGNTYGSKEKSLPPSPARSQFLGCLGQPPLCPSARAKSLALLGTIFSSCSTSGHAAAIPHLGLCGDGGVEKWDTAPKSHQGFGVWCLGLGRDEDLG